MTPSRWQHRLSPLLLTIFFSGILAFNPHHHHSHHGNNSHENYEVTTTIRWGSHCPQECQCHQTSLGHTHMAHWLRDIPPSSAASSSEFEDILKASVCVIGKETFINKFFKKIPSDTQVLTLLHAEDAPPVVIMNHLSHLNQLLGLEIRDRGYEESSLDVLDEDDDDTYHSPEIEDTDDELEATSTSEFNNGDDNNNNKRIKTILESESLTMLPSGEFALGADALRSLRKLRYLSLRGVDMSALPDHPFAKLRGLRCLHLHRNNLDTITEDSLIGLSSLEELAIVDNGITEIPQRAFSELPVLRRLKLTNNRISVIEATTLANLQQLRLLDLSGNNISHISMLSFPPLHRLVTLYLDQNPIKVVFLQAFHTLKNIRLLTLGGARSTPMHIMKYSFKGLGSLRSLVLPGVDNDILEMDMFDGLSSLRTLELPKGRVAAVGPDAFVGAAETLRIVRLTGARRLKRLHQKAFNGMSNLKILDLSRNALSKLPSEVFAPLKSLRHLDLHDNHLMVLPSFWPSTLQSLRLDQNSWSCSCPSLGLWSKVVTYIKRTPPVAYSALCAKQQKHPKDRRSRWEFHCSRAAAAAISKESRLRPICMAPNYHKGRRVLDALRKEQHCQDPKT